MIRFFFNLAISALTILTGKTFITDNKVQLVPFNKSSLSPLSLVDPSLLKPLVF